MSRPLLALLLIGCPKTQEPAAVEAPPTVWSARVADAKTRPEPLASVLKDVYDVRLLVAASFTVDGLQLVLAPAAEDGTQDRCAPTSALSPIRPAADGSFTRSNLILTVSADGFVSTLVDASLAGRWDGGTLSLDRVDGRMDTAPFVTRVGNSLGPDAICTMLPALGPCEPCAGSAGPTCWNIGVDSLSLTPSQATVVRRTPEEICADEACKASRLCAGG